MSDDDVMTPVTTIQAYTKASDAPPVHSGLDYFAFLRQIDKALGPRSYFEVGTYTGDSLRCFSCDAICVDPELRVDKDAIAQKRRLFLFQCTSDEFFAQNDLGSYLQDGVDVAFLDGLHHFEALLRDFINTERFCRPTSLVLMHDCLPTSDNGTSRDVTPGFWLGDVWRVLPALQKYRPDLRILLLDCPPSGLVACTDLDPASKILDDNFDAIVAEFGTISFADYGVEKLWGLYPVVDTARLQSDPVAMRMLRAGQTQEREGDATTRGVMSLRVGELVGREVSDLASGTLQLKDFASRVADVIAKLVSLQSDMLRALSESDGVQAALVGFFTQPLPARLRQPVEPWQTLSHRVQLGFDPGADVQLTVEPKLDHSLSPESCLNTVTIEFRGESQYLCLGAWCSWADVAATQRYQLGLYGVPDRPVSCNLVLRLPKKGGGEVDVQLSSFDLRPEERACNPSGPVLLPDDMEIDRDQNPLLLIFFDTRHDLELRLDYISVYFA